MTLLLSQIDAGLPLHVEGAVRFSPYLPDSGAADAAGATGSRTVTCVAIEDEVKLTIVEQQHVGATMKAGVLANSSSITQHKSIESCMCRT